MFAMITIKNIPISASHFNQRRIGVTFFFMIGYLVVRQARLSGSL